MIKLKILIFVLSFFTSITFAQEEDSLNFYPFHVGDTWQYLYVPENYFRQTVVLSIDTLYADSSVEITTSFEGSFEVKYKIFFNDRHTIYWDIDTGWSVAYKFDVPVNSNWLSYPSFPLWTIYTGEFWDNYYLFQDSVLVREYWETYDTNSTLYTGSHRLAKDIGFYYAEGEFSYTYLTGCIVNGKQYGTIVSIDENPEIIAPSKIELKSYPNPFNPVTTIEYVLPMESYVKLSVYNSLGEKITVLVDEYQQIGKYKVQFSASEINALSSGVYFYSLQADYNIITKKMVLMR